MRFSRLASLLPALPASLALQIPLAEDVYGLAAHLVESIQHNGGVGLGHGSHGTPGTVLSPASDIDLASVPTDEHYVITSALHPNYKMRIKRHDGWCEPDARSYSGYLDVGHGKELFFYFFESRANPKEDPVLMWINGGPGGSSSMGLFMELGPCTVKADPKTANDTKPNPYSWNEHANIFFLDEPIGVGFSRAAHGQKVGTTQEAAEDVKAFIQIFFDTFKEFEGRAFHMTGESYGGRYLPLFASAVYDGNKALRAAGKKPINLQSVMIGNGMTDFFTTTESYWYYLQVGQNQTVQDIETCVQLGEAARKCHQLTKRSCIDSHDYTDCAIAVGFCSLTLTTSFQRAGINPYDVSMPCTQAEYAESLCYPETVRINQYLDLPDVRKILGVDQKEPIQTINWEVNMQFALTQDITGKTWLYVAELLERGIRVLNYAGTLDFICNHAGNERWQEALEWTGKEGYNAEKLQEWNVDGKLAGYYKTYKNFSHLKILGAGHMTPMDQPHNSLVFLERWLDGKDFN